MSYRGFLSILCVSVIGVGLAVSTGHAQKPKIEEELKLFLPGLLFDQRQRTEDTEFEKTSPFPSSRYAKTQLTKSELMNFYQKGEYNKVILGILKLARSGDAWALETIGLMYRLEQGIDQDNELAAKWLMRAAEQQRPLAQHHLGVMYFGGEGIYKDYLKSAMFLDLAIKNYPEGPEKTRAVEDYSNIILRLSKIEKARSSEMSKKFLADFPTQTAKESKNDALAIETDTKNDAEIAPQNP